ncbi:helix-turn-helix transcriptional regulator [Streptomyces spinoverrucosus]|uniref:Helix-turn-helix transcriptional regulator n=1 Tax=Streptomyces spinoverrucosus TaxID=284043 RepID=A0A4Y3VBH0_9ACTN|nr:helix-turn-helix transcriptional regulator [Streptomyces spinoverrucosus]GEC04224.1 helix-turn-helix transcriptional regulator [Streptomyces spinoverrucosus]GHB47053.1 helix-turn-helix transcriptional regulator [Streptomyces spinoverrucosus]
MADHSTGTGTGTDTGTASAASQALRRARDAVAREAWAEAYRLLSGVSAGLTPDDFAAYADAAWWTSHVEESITARMKAYAGYVAAGAERRAGYCAWMLFYEHQLAGRTAVAAGWLRRARRHLSGEPECVEQCYLAWMEAEAAAARGAFDEAMAVARRMAGIARQCGSPDLYAMSVQAQAGVLLAQGRVAEGLDLLDDAMCSAMAGELSAFFTGWIYCLGLQRCMACADLERAAEWTDAAMKWCAAMPAENNFRGLCRVHRVQVLDLRGRWPQALDQAVRTCEELLPYERRIAGEAFCATGDIQRRRGELAAAEAAYQRAHELGRDPQPGLALLRLAQGRPEASATALRLALAGGADDGDDRLGRCRLLAAQVEISLALGRLDEARAAAAELETLARDWQQRRASHTTMLHAVAASAGGAVAYAEHDLDRALSLLRRALALWLALDVPYEEAQVRMTLAAADRTAGDDEGARMELRAARATFERLGAVPDARRAAALLGSAGGRQPGELTDREIQVLRLVAAGRTNRAIAAELVISEHTVARHLNNIFAKLDVNSRAAATAYAYQNRLA